MQCAATGIKPTDNAFIEAFNSCFRAECPNAHWFVSLADAREKMEDWRNSYSSEERPHGAIGQKTPVITEPRWRSQPAMVSKRRKSNRSKVRPHCNSGDPKFGLTGLQ